MEAATQELFWKNNKKGATKILVKSLKTPPKALLSQSSSRL